MIRTLLITLLLVSAVFSRATSPNPSFYEFKNSAKLLAKIESTLLFENDSLRYTLQNTNSYTLTQSACFFNQPSNTFHYILTTTNNSTLHFQIPVLELGSSVIFSKAATGEEFLELACKGEKGILVKEHSNEGLITYNLYFTSFQIPLNSKTNTKKLNKLFEKLIANVQDFNQ